MDAEELIQHCNEIAARMREIRGEPADRLVHVTLGSVSRDRFEELRSIKVVGVAVRDVLFTVDKPRCGFIPMLTLTFGHVEVSVTGEPQYHEAA